MYYSYSGDDDQGIVSVTESEELHVEESIGEAAVIVTQVEEPVVVPEVRPVAEVPTISEMVAEQDDEHEDNGSESIVDFTNLGNMLQYYRNIQKDLDFELINPQPSHLKGKYQAQQQRIKGLTGVLESRYKEINAEAAELIDPHDFKKINIADKDKTLALLERMVAVNTNNNSGPNVVKVSIWR